MFLLYMHATHWGVQLFTATSGKNDHLKLIIFGYFAPLIAGGVLLLFMLKPLLAPRSKEETSRRLEKEDDPVLFDFVSRLCEVVGAPVPAEIRLDGRVNASAGFRNGRMAIFSRQLVLTIGAPLVAGLTLRQFTGVLAHEFGHFTQGSGMRLTYVVRSVQAWFARVVYERDAWDERLVRWSNLPLREVQGVFWMTQFCVWLGRRVLWVLMYAGHAVSCFMLRQMEFDADRCEAHVAGSETFVATAERLQILNVAWQGAMADTRHLLADGHLADDICELLLANVRQIPAEASEALRTAIAAEKTRWFHTHPCDAERIASARAENTEGVFRIDGPTTVLFECFPKLAREVSTAFYQDSLGANFASARLVPTATALSRQNTERQEAEIRDRFFGGVYNAVAR